MNKVMEISLNGATKGQIKKQFELRVSHLKSEQLKSVADYFMRYGVKRKIEFDELKGFLKAEQGKVYSLVSQLKNTHGFEIVNHSCLGKAGVYQLVGFTYRNCDQEKKIIEASDKKQRLINSVFC
mgnify:CR=1 FL=1